MKRTALILVVLGAVFGYSLAGGEEYGALLDGTEKQAMAETLQYALEYNPTDQESSWVNPDSGTSGAIVPVNTYINERGLYCREYIQTIIIGGEEQLGYGTACRRPDGTWVIVVDQPAAGYARVAEKTTYVYVYRDPYVHYYPWVYDHPYHYPHRIFFSFVFVRHSGPFHHVHFRDGLHFKGNHRHLRDHRPVQRDRFTRGSVRHPDRHHIVTPRQDDRRQIHRGDDYRGTVIFREDRSVRRDSRLRGTEKLRDGPFRGDRHLRGTVRVPENEIIRRDPSRSIRDTQGLRGQGELRHDRVLREPAGVSGGRFRGEDRRGGGIVHGERDIRRDDSRGGTFRDHQGFQNRRDGGAERPAHIRGDRGGSSHSRAGGGSGRR